MTGRPVVLTALAAEFDDIYAALTPLAVAFAEVVGGAGPTRSEHLAAMRPAIFQALADHRGLLAGAGVFAVPGLCADARYCLEWWWSRAARAPEALRVNLDPTAPDFFDYAREEWFAVPMSSAAPSVCGPYVDYACTNEYALTIATPVRVAGSLVGIVAGDVLVATLEQRLMPALLRMRTPAVLANAQGRAVVSTSPAHVPGQRMPVGGGARPRSAVPGRSRTFGWQVLPAN